MSLSARDVGPSAFGCPVCSSHEHEQVHTPLADGTLVPMPVHRCCSCHVYFLAPGTLDRDGGAAAAANGQN